MLQIEQLNKSYDSKQVLFDINLTVEDGTILGLIGKNGSGKTTLFHSILNFVNFQGQIKLDDHPISVKDYDQIGYLPEERSLIQKLTVFDQIKYLANLHGLKNSEVKAQLPLWLEKLQVKGSANDKIKSLSKGNQQKVQLIATLIHNPKLVILDEPFSGLDPVNVDVMKKVILDLKKSGTTVIFSDHNMANVEQLCDSVAMINQGKLAINGKVNEVRESFGLTRLFVRTDKKLEELASLPGVEQVELTASGSYRLLLQDESFGEEIFKLLSGGQYLRTFDQEPPTLEEIFKMEAGVDNHE